MTSATTTGWTRDQIAQRVAQDIPNGSYVNLGIGIPELVASHVPAPALESALNEAGASYP